MNGISLKSNFLTHLTCSSCRRMYEASTVQTFCGECSKPLLTEYDLAAVKRRLSPAQLRHRVETLWRYRELLPVVNDENIVSLGEGWTPLYEAHVLGRALGLPKLLIKEEAVNPTGSFKARGMCVAVSKAKESGIFEVAVPSAGNAGGALAAYAAKAGMTAHVFVPNDTPIVNINEVKCYGANIYLVDGVISDAAKRMNEMNKEKTWFDMSTMKEPYRLEGKKTMGYELAEQFNWKLPDVIIYPAGGGTGLIGMWKAFRELEELGWLEARRPKMVVVQSSGCAPVVKAFNERKKISAFWEHSHTIASGLRVPKAFADELILTALYESNGTAVAVTDDELLADMKFAARSEGLLLCPEGAAGVSAARKLVTDGFIQDSDTVVVFNTGSGYKYIEAIERISG